MFPRTVTRDHKSELSSMYDAAHDLSAVQIHLCLSNSE